MEVKKLSPDFQHIVLKLMLTNEMFAWKCLEYLHADYFDNKYLAWTFTKIKWYNEEFKKTPHPRFLVDQLKNIAESEQESYKASVKKILSVDITDIEYLKTEITNFIRTSEFKKMHIKEADLFNNEKYEEAYEFVQETIEKIKKITFDTDDYVKAFDIDQALIESRNSQKDFIPTGITFFDKELFGGLPKNSVTTVLGPWNIGKSIVGICMAYYAAMAGKKVLYIFHEGRKNQIVLRFLSRITGIPYFELMAGTYIDDEIKVQKICEAKIFIEKYIRIKEMREVGVSVEDVYHYCKATKKEWPFDMLMDDYGQKLTSSKSKHKELRHVLGHIWSVFDLMSSKKDLDIAVVTLGQINREGVIKNRAGNGVLRSENVSECAQIAHHSETIITINKSADDDDAEELILVLDKARDSRAGAMVRCKSSFRSMKAYDPKLGIEHVGYDVPAAPKKKKQDEDE